MTGGPRAEQGAAIMIIGTGADGQTGTDLPEAGATTAGPGRTVLTGRASGHAAPVVIPEFDPAPAYRAGLRDARLLELERILHPPSGPVDAAPGEAAPIEVYGDGDERLVRELRQHGFSGEPYAKVHQALIVYGYRICQTAIADGTMRQWSMQRGRPAGEEPTDQDDIDRLAADVAIEGAELFRCVALVRGGWSRRRVSLATSYIEGCIHAYPGGLRRWHQHRADKHGGGTAEWVLGLLQGVDVRELRILLSSSRQYVDEGVYVALAMGLDGMPEDVIAAALGCGVERVPGMFEHGRDWYLQRQRCLESHDE
jgi:hypothetical protein